MINILFVCSKNQWRSPTAERIFAKQPGIHVRSAGTSSSARRKISASDIEWADIILVMEDKHKARITFGFRDAARHTHIDVLDIPDDYPFMDENLIEILRAKVHPYLS
ncbi:low molecular weight protein tyrosine phosphatase family protein [Robiginitomaculum antarcticum]|uniref:low molecular weight protein tyrosine phosphatase family protein n=1 Tax=Robiginitomaculum antarcticum TaxID=437507 RepID=UPI000369D9DB|nr:hypothetical protein [Robiginitomaculum antarcticum]